MGLYLEFGGRVAMMGEWMIGRILWGLGTERWGIQGDDDNCCEGMMDKLYHRLFNRLKQT
jgi:hypothetical protein